MTESSDGQTTAPPQKRETGPMSDLPETRHSLLLQLRDRSDEAWAEFLLVYEHAIFSFCRHQGLQDSDARDVTQEVLVAFHRRLSDWDQDSSKGKLRGWLFRVARNLAVNKYRERVRRAASGDSQTRSLLAELPTAEGSQENAAFLLEYRRSVMHRAAERVRPHVQDSSWQAFWKTAVEGVKPAQVAEELGLSVGSVYAAKCRVFARIRQTIDTFSDESAFLESPEP